MATSPKSTSGRGVSSKSARATRVRAATSRVKATTSINFSRSVRRK